MADPNKKHRYSFIYNDLVSGENDFVGLVAYSIYKEEKIAYVKAFEEKEGREPEPCELEDFHTLARQRVAQYTELAENRVSNFGQLLYGERLEALEEERARTLKREIEKISPSWWRGVSQSIVGSLIYSIMLGVIIMAILCAQHGASWILKECMDVLMPPA